MVKAFLTILCSSSRIVIFCKLGSLDDNLPVELKIDYKWYEFYHHHEQSFVIL